MSDEHPTYNGRYQVQRRIARGGMAEVFLAQDLLLARPVAVKVLFPEFAGDPAFVARFRREAQAAANLNHPNIVGVYDWGQEGGTYYIVMEYIDGRSLSEILRTQGMPPAKTAAGIAADVAAALGFAHRNGVVHRDVKPGNIMITNGGHVKVADFGIARAMTASAEDNLTQTGSVMGTATYFSPEQAQGHSVDQRSDLYSLGIVMYEMADGKPPFTADSPVAVAYKHVQEAPASLRQAHPEVPADYEAIVFKLLAKDPDDRYPDAEALRADLRRFAEGQSVRARPGTVAAAAGGAALGAAAAASAGGTGAVPPTGVPVPDPAPTEPPYEQARRSRTGWYVLLLVILLAVLGGLLFAFASLLGIGEESGVTVPDVVSRPVAEAQSTLEAVGFKVDLTPSPQPSTEVAAGSVISQDPPAGSTHDAGTVVRLVVSSGQPDEDQATVPDVEDDLVADARRKLNAAGFTNLAPIVEEESEDVPRGRVISQFPMAGIESVLSTEIQLIVSSGLPPTTPPPTPPPTQPTSSSSSSTSSSSSSTSSSTTSTSSTTTPTSSSTTSTSTSDPEDPEE